MTLTDMLRDIWYTMLCHDDDTMFCLRDISGTEPSPTTRPVDDICTYNAAYDSSYTTCIGFRSRAHTHDEVVRSEALYDKYRAACRLAPYASSLSLRWRIHSDTCYRYAEIDPDSATHTFNDSVLAVIPEQSGYDYTYSVVFYINNVHTIESVWHRATMPALW